MPQRFPYVEVDPILGAASALPYAPITLQLADRKVQVSGLIDSGSTLNVLPFDAEPEQVREHRQLAGRAEQAALAVGSEVTRAGPNAPTNAPGSGRRLSTVLRLAGSRRRALPPPRDQATTGAKPPGRL